MLKMASFFAGVGGIDLGFEKAGFQTIWANERDKYAVQTYQYNFDNEIILDDIVNIKEKSVPDVDILLAGFPCQAFSVAGYRKGFEDERGNVFFEVVRIIKEKRPPIIFLENVKNLVGHDKGNTFKVILEALQTYGYSVKYKVLNACEYGNVPQNRERIYVVGFLDEEVAEKFKFPDPILLTKTIKDTIDFENKKDDKYYYTDEKYDFYDKLEESINSEDTIYQWRRVYVRENKSNVCPTLTANMGTGGHNVPLIYTKYGIRKLTPRECFNIQGYPREYIVPEDVSNTQLYKQAGNSVVVPVVQRIAENIKVALGASEKKSELVLS
jgi:DNA (cytosine-5)-methyltransferase 1